MSEAQTRLNLIQRAMQRAVASPEAAPVQRATLATEAASLQRAEVSPEAAVVAGTVFGEAKLLGENAFSEQIVTPAAPPRPPAESIQVRTGAKPVHLDRAKLSAHRIITPDNTSSATYAEFRSLKRKLIPMTCGNAVGATAQNVVMISSALPGEGKTFTAVNLAISLAAESNLNVILVDGDVVHNSATAYFHGEHQDGLFDLLTGKRERIEDVLHPCADLPGLHIIFAGKQHASAPELLASSRMGSVCSALSKHFDQSIVLFDMPPILAASEPAAMAAHVDHLLMVIAAGKAARHQVESALAEVSRCPSISLLFNRSPDWERPISDSYSYYAYASGKSGGG